MVRIKIEFCVWEMFTACNDPAFLDVSLIDLWDAISLRFELTLPRTGGVVEVRATISGLHADTLALPADVVWVAIRI